MPSEQLGDLLIYLLTFWAGALVVIWLIGRRVFREQINELRTIRRLLREISPFYKDFDTDTIRTWVELASDHLWAGWRNGDLTSLRDYSTDAFQTTAAARIAERERQGQIHDAKLHSILKVHPLGLYMVGDGPPPADTELMLRLETKAVDCVRDRQGQVVEGKPGAQQVQHLWTLRHDGDRWRLHAVERATGDVKDLADRPPVPPVGEWARPRSGEGH